MPSCLQRTKVVPTASDLASAIASGDANAETALVVKYAEGVLYILRREMRDRTVAEDLCQETFRVVLERLRKRRLSEPEKLEKFIVGVARKLCQAHRRAAARLSSFSDSLDETEDAGPTPFDQAVRNEERRLLLDAIARLNVLRDRELLKRYLMDEDKQTLCELFGLAPQQLNKVISRARSRLRSILVNTNCPEHEV